MIILTKTVNFLTRHLQDVDSETASKAAHEYLTKKMQESVEQQTTHVTEMLIDPLSIVIANRRENRKYTVVHYIHGDEVGTIEVDQTPEYLRVEIEKAKSEAVRNAQGFNE